MQHYVSVNWWHELWLETNRSGNYKVCSFFLFCCSICKLLAVVCVADVESCFELLRKLLVFCCCLLFRPLFNNDSVLLLMCMLLIRMTATMMMLMMSTVLCCYLFCWYHIKTTTLTKQSVALPAYAGCLQPAVNCESCCSCC